MQDYNKRMILPLEGFELIKFSTKSNLEIGLGYNRVVIGQRGPYIEFLPRHIIRECFLAIVVPHKYYVEYRSMCKSNVKLYYQLLVVDYADYKPGMCYISPFDLISDKYPILITELERKRKK